MVYLLFPKRITLENNISLEITKDKVKDEELFALLVPEERVDEVVNYLKKNEGFSSALPSFDKGEDYGISRILIPPWELHMRIYNYCIIPGMAKINAHIEIARKYLQHLNFRYVQPVIYEPYKFYKKIFSEFLLLYNSRYTVQNIDENYWFRLQNPVGRLIPWTPSGVISYTFSSIAERIRRASKK